MFPHTFEPDDVTVLLERVEPNYLSREERQTLIDQGTHYNELISKEQAPSASEMTLFNDQVLRFGNQMAEMVIQLAKTIAGLESKPVLVSLVRAGTPTGVLLKRCLAMMDVEAPHFSVSIVQGKGFDEVAIEHILSLGYAPSQLIFIDGWTGKGVVRRELSEALKTLSAKHGAFRDELFVLSDIAGVAEHAATREDVLVPSALLSGPLCGLVSRTIYRGSPEAPKIHAAAYLDYMEDMDVSRHFVEVMTLRIKAAMRERSSIGPVMPASEANRQMQAFLDKVSKEWELAGHSRIKPGVGESSRLFLRKKPMLLMVKDECAPAVQHLLELAREKDVPIKVDRHMPYQACTLVR